MRVLPTFLLFLAVIVLISNASPPKKRRAKAAVGAPKRPFKSVPRRQNSAAARAAFGPKSAGSKQFKKVTGPNNSRSLQKGIASGSSNNGSARRATAARARVGSRRSRPNTANNKRRGPGVRKRNRPANRPPFVKMPDETLFDDELLDDEQYLDEIPDNDSSFDLPEYKGSLGKKPSGTKTSSNRTVGRSNDDFFDDDLTLDDDIFGNITDYDDLSEIAGKYDASNDELLKDLNLYDDEENGGKTNVLDQLPAESGSEETSVEKDCENKDEEGGKDTDETVGEVGSEQVEKPSSDTQPTAKISDGNDYDFEDLNAEELSEGDYEEDDEDDDTNYN